MMTVMWLQLKKKHFHSLDIDSEIFPNKHQAIYLIQSGWEDCGQEEVMDKTKLAKS